MAIAVVTGGKNKSQSGSVVIASLNTTGATLAIAAINRFGGSSGTISDSDGNTWTALTTVNSAANNEFLQCWYSILTTTSSSNTVTMTGGSNTYRAGVVAFFSGTKATSPLDQQATSANQAQGTTHLAPSVTPSEDNELVISLLGTDGPASMTADSITGGFTIYQYQTPASSTGCGLAYLIQTTAGAAAPTWTISSASSEGGMNSSTYKSAAAATTNYKANTIAF